MASEDERRPREEPAPSGDALDAHPVEPAEGAPQPGEDADALRPPHPDEPAEGER